MAPLIDGLAFQGPIADKAFDSNAIIADLDERSAKGGHLPASAPSRQRPIDADIYKWRRLIENFFCKLKGLRRVAMRGDKTDQSFSAMIHLAAAVIHSR